MGAALVGIIGGHAKKYSFKGLAAAEKIQYKINVHDSPLTLLPPPPQKKKIFFTNQACCLDSWKRMMCLTEYQTG